MRRPRSPTVPTRVLDEDEQMVYFPSEGKGDAPEAHPPMPKRLSTSPTKDGDVFVVEGVLGRGAYNCAHLIRNKEGVMHVLRLAYLINLLHRKRSNDGVLRGLELVHALQAYKGMLGPSLIEETTKYRVFDETEENEHFAGDICPHIRSVQQIARVQDDAKGNRFALQHLEYLRGGFYHISSIHVKGEQLVSDDERNFGIFSLVWFLAVSQSTFDLMHHDLKAGNIIYRVSAQSQQYHFTLDGQTLHFNSHYVPVIIDYDRSSVNVTEDQDARVEIGTLVTSSPDALLYGLCKRNAILYPMSYNARACDWWSVGITILGTHKTNLRKRFASICKAYAKHILDANALPFIKNRRKTNEEFLEAFFYSCLVASVMSGTARVQPSSEWYPYVQQLFPLTFDTDMTDNAQYQDLFNWAYRQRNYETTYMIKRMMHWNPAERNHHGDPMEYLRHFHNTFVPVQSYKEDTTDGFFYRINDSHNMPVVHLEGYPLLKHELMACLACQVSNEAMFLCPCCNDVYCGEVCQAKKH